MASRFPEPPPRHDPIGPEGLLDGIVWRAVWLGALVDVIVTAVANLPLTAAFAPGAFAEDPAVAEEAMAAAYASTEFLVLAMLVGITATVYGAYFGARRAGARHLRHGGWIAIVSLAVGILPLALVELGPAPPFWYEILGVLLMLPAGLLGGLLAEIRDRRAP